MIKELAMQLRGLVTRATVSTVDDTGETQTATLQGRAGAEMTEVEILQPFGFASTPPDGGLVIVLAVGGDQGDPVALPIAAPGSRMGKVPAGEAVLYGKDGSRVHVKADGSIDVISSKVVHVAIPDVAEFDVTMTYVRGKMASGERFVAGAGFAKLVAGGHFIAATAGGPKASAAVTLGAEPSPDL